MNQLFNKCRLFNVLSVFFHDPAKPFQLRQIGRIIKLHHKSVSVYVKRLLSMDLIKANERMLYKSYIANTDSLLFVRYKKIANLIQLYESGLVDFLCSKFNYPEAIVLFGSFSKGDDIPVSDIDVLVITAAQKQVDLAGYEKTLGHKIHLFQYSRKAFDKAGKELKNSWINGIILYGYLEVLK